MAPDDDLEAASDLPVLDLEDTDLGVRTEDRYAAIPPGPRLVRRREHQNRDQGPAVLLLVALALLFAVAAWLDGISSDEPDATGVDGAVPEALDEETGAVLVAVGNDGASSINVDGRAVRPLFSLDEPVRDALVAQHTLVVRGSADTVAAFLLAGGSRHELPRAESLLRSDDPTRVWLVERDEETSRATEITAADGTVTDEVEVAGRVLGATSAGLVVADPAGTLQLVGGASPVPLDPNLAFLASAPNAIASRTGTCNADACELVIARLDRGIEQRVDLTVGAGGQEDALFSPDGRRLAVVRSDGVESHGVIVDVDEGTVVTFAARAPAREANRPLAWSSGGDWLFIATERNGLDAVDADGTVARVDVELPATEALLLTE